ncbi:MAG TPA: glycosyltransferase family 2 protein [Aggregatilineales bacterium]|nr:glycosyltransferase family 2 protein [Aggregatilineales bacterium]
MHDYPYDISMVLPVYNEAHSIREVHTELEGVLESMGLRYEVIYVDDGSRDESPARLREISAESHSTKIVFLRRNFGQTAAIQAGIDRATGAIITLMDSDLQNDPNEIPRMYARMEDGLDLVSGWRKKRRDNLIRRIPSVIANRLISAVTGVRLHDYGCTLKMYRREVLDHVHLYGEMHRFIPVLAYAAGASIDEMVVNHRPRLYGKSKYTLWRTLKVVLDLMTVSFLTRYNTRPMYIFGGSGFFFGFAGMLLLLTGLFYTLLNDSAQLAGTMGFVIPGIVLMMGGIQTILMGLLIEMLMRTYYESQHKKPYTIREILDSPRESLAVR